MPVRTLMLTDAGNHAALIVMLERQRHDLSYRDWGGIYARRIPSAEADQPAVAASGPMPRRGCPGESGPRSGDGAPPSPPPQGGLL
jgi:hypothetical protein